MDQRVCVIVGAGEGLGRSLAAAFATKGFAIALLSRSEKGSAAALEAARGANPTAKVRFFAGDATQAPALEAAVARAATEMGGCDVLIYNARGDLRYKPPLQIEYDELRAILDVEVAGALAAAKAVMPSMIEKQRGTVIFSSATAEFRGSATNPLYAIGKLLLGRGQSAGVTKASVRAETTQLVGWRSALALLPFLISIRRSRDHSQILSQRLTIAERAVAGFPKRADTGEKTQPPEPTL